jgi:hypothetical protein
MRICIKNNLFDLSNFIQIFKYNFLMIKIINSLMLKKLSIIFLRLSWNKE